MTVKVNQISGMPDVSGTLEGWKHDITLVKLSRTITDGVSTPTETEHEYSGTVQPLSPQQIKLKDEGQRSWSWWQIHIDINAPVELIPDDRIVYNGLKLKVMAKRNYTLNGYIEYHAIEDYAR